MSGGQGHEDPMAPLVAGVMIVVILVLSAAGLWVFVRDAGEAPSASEEVFCLGYEDGVAVGVDDLAESGAFPPEPKPCKEVVEVIGLVSDNPVALYCEGHAAGYMVTVMPIVGTLPDGWLGEEFDSCVIQLSETVDPEPGVRA